MPSRPPHRQGVVYGPPRPSDARGAKGNFLGRLAGLVVIVLAVAVLAAAGVVVLGGPRTSGPPPTPTTRPSFGPLPTLISPSASPPPSPAASADPTPFLPIVQVGPGFVTFGTRAADDMTIEDPRAAFQVDETVTWSAFLSEPATADVVVRVLKLDPGASGAERLFSEASLLSRDEGALHVVRRVRLARVIDGPGIYVVRYVRGDTVLAEGYFLVEG